MENNKNSYIKTDDNKVINEKYIRWIKKMNECLEICTKFDGCTEKKNTHPVCKLNSPVSYDKLNKLFE
jgi:hypothetical protein